MLKNTINTLASAVKGSSNQEPVFNISSNQKYRAVLDRNNVDTISCMCGNLDNVTEIAKMYETDKELFIACKKKKCRKKVSRKISPTGEL